MCACQASNSAPKDGYVFRRITNGGREVSRRDMRAPELQTWKVLNVLMDGPYGEL